MYTFSPRLAGLVLLALLASCRGSERPAEGGAAAADSTPLTSDAAEPMDTTPSGTPAPPSPQTVAEDLRRVVTARLAEWSIALSRDTVPAGDISFQVMNTGTMEHALEVEGPGIERETEHIRPGETTTLTVPLQPGTYEVYCPVEAEGPDHEARGMRTTLVVTPA